MNQKLEGNRNLKIFLLLFLFFFSVLLSCATRLSLRPTPSPYEVGLSIFQKGEILGAIQEWEKVEARHPHFQQAQEMISVANNILTELVTLHLQYGSNLEKEGRLSEALLEYQRALMLDSRRRDVEEKIQKVREILVPLMQYHLKRAQGLEAAGKLQQAWKEYRLLQVFDPNDQEVYQNSVRLQERIETEATQHYQAGLYHFQNRSYRSARHHMKAALLIQPDHAGAKCYLDAIERALQAERRRQESGEDLAIRLGLRERRARLQELLTAGDWVQARKEAKSVVEIDPYDMEAKRMLALSQARCKEKAEYLFQEGIRHFQNEDLDSAISVWQQVLILDEHHGKVKEYLEKAHLMREKIRRIRQERVGPAS
ncbi:MAG: hypothetical protein QHH30_01320 [candidate division NC10 bacterium]|nr:hypothetical protein [candidate division NC10 bacterium]